MIKWKDRHYNDQMKTDITMIKWKDTLQWSNENRHYNDQMKRQTLQWSNEKAGTTMIKW
jgi:hypothetical protein